MPKVMPLGPRIRGPGRCIHDAVFAHETKERRFCVVRRFPPEVTSELTGVAPSDVRKAARLYAAAEGPMQLHGLGMTENCQGSEGVMLLCNLAVLEAASAARVWA